MEQLLVKKYDGTLMPFDRSRLLNSLKGRVQPITLQSLLPRPLSWSRTMVLQQKTFIAKPQSC